MLNHVIVFHALQLREGFTVMRLRGLSTGRNFAVFGGVYASIECLLDKARGASDLKNHVAAGAVTGAVLAARAGSKAMLVGAAGISTFTVGIDILMHSLSEGQDQ